MNARNALPSSVVAVVAARMATVRSILLIPFLAAGIAPAQVPPDIEAGLRKIGQIVDPGCTAKLYRPLMPVNDINSSVTPLYPGVTIARNISFGPDPKDLVDVYTADKGGGSRTVLMYISGGQGNKTEQQVREANAFYDNIGRWGTRNGMVVAAMQRHAGSNWDDGAKDVSRMIQWVEANVSQYQGNPERMFIWAQSAGNGPLGTYMGHPEIYGPKGVGVKGAIFMSGQFNILPLNPPNPAGPGGAFSGTGSTCGAGGQGVIQGAIAGPAAAVPTPPAGGRGRGAAQPVDEATQLARSSLPELKKTKVALFFATAELDPGINGTMSPFFQTLHDELCKEGSAHCPTMLFEKGESHMSEVFSIDTPDQTVSKPILEWIKKVK